MNKFSDEKKNDLQIHFCEAILFGSTYDLANKYDVGLQGMISVNN